MNADWRENPATEQQKEKLRFFECAWEGEITAGQASDALEQCAKEYPDAEAAFNGLPATENQKLKLRFFGCTWDGDISASQARDALAECARQFPDAEASWQNSRHATEEQKDKLRFFGCTWTGEITAEQASNALMECAKQFPGKEMAWQKQKRVLPGSTATFRQATTVKNSQTAFNTETPPTAFEHEEVPISKWFNWFQERNRQQEVPVPIAETVTNPEKKLTYDEARQLSQKEWNDWITIHGSYGTEPGHQLTYGEARGLSEEQWNKWRVLHGRLDARQATDEKMALSVGHRFPPEPKRSDPKYQAWDNPAGQGYGFALDHLRWEETVKQIKAQIEAEKLTQDRKPAEPQSASSREFPVTDEIAPRFGMIRPKQEPANEVTIQETTKSPRKNPNEYTIPARELQDFAQHRPAIQRPAAYKIATPIEQFAKWVADLLRRNQTCHWFPAGPLNYAFTQNTFLSTGLCRQMADTIESKGYCVEPDVRFGSGPYEWNQTLALFKPFDGDPLQPSTAYLGAANLLRLCILITTADGQIDLCELEVFHQAIENQTGLTLTDHKRLLVLEQLFPNAPRSGTRWLPCGKRSLAVHCPNARWRRSCISTAPKNSGTLTRTHSANTSLSSCRPKGGSNWKS